MLCSTVFNPPLQHQHKTRSNSDQHHLQPSSRVREINDPALLATKVPDENSMTESSTLDPEAKAQQDLLLVLLFF